MAVATEINIFRPHSRKKETTIRSLIPKQAVDALAEKLGHEAAEAANAALRSMKRNDMDMVQLRLGDRRIRIYQGT